MSTFTRQSGQFSCHMAWRKCGRGGEIIVHQTMKNGFEDIEENSFDIKVAPTGNMLTWSVVGDFDNDDEEDDVIRYVTYRNK